MPEPVKSVVGSFSGIKEADGIIAWPFSLKKFRNFYQEYRQETEILVAQTKIFKLKLLVVAC